MRSLIPGRVLTSVGVQAGGGGLYLLISKFTSQQVSKQGPGFVGREGEAALYVITEVDKNFSLKAIYWGRNLNALLSITFTRRLLLNWQRDCNNTETWIANLHLTKLGCQVFDEKMSTTHIIYLFCPSELYMHVALGWPRCMFNCPTAREL